MEKISVVVPVYNAELYLEECIKNILCQTYSFLELILVDDGSTDNSGKICEEYEKRDARVRVIHKQNGGVMSARKTGIEKAEGEYLLFVDADDWIEKNTCEGLYSIAVKNNADVVRFPLIVEGKTFSQVRQDGIPVGIYGESQKDDLVKRLICSFDGTPSGTNNSISTQLTKTELLKKFYQELSDELKYGEDFIFVVLTILQAKVSCFIDTPYYHYRMNDTSTTHTSNFYYYIRVNLLFLYLRKVFMESEYKEILIPQLERYTDELILRGMNRRFIIPRSNRIPDYVFPLNTIPIASRIILYGAGVIGKSYFKYLKATGLFHIVGWVDKEWEKYKQDKFPVVSPGKLSCIEYDIVIVAVKSEMLYKQILQILLDKYEVDSKKVVWIEPMHILDFYSDDNVL